MAASYSLHADWTTTVFSSSLPSTVTDLALIYESLTSASRMKDECRITKEEWILSYLNGRLYSLAYPRKWLLKVRLHGNLCCTRVGFQEYISMETCFILSCFLETAYMSQYCSVNNLSLRVFSITLTTQLLQKIDTRRFKISCLL
jgi:hypothetical protein